MRMIDYVKRQDKLPAAPIGGTPKSPVPLKSGAGYYDAENNCNRALALIKDYGYDFYVAGSDDVMAAHDIGLPIACREGHKPYIVEHAVKTSKILKQISVPNPIDGGLLGEAVKLVKMLRESTDILIMANQWGPFTLAGGFCGAADLSMKIITEPDFVHELMDFTTEICIALAKAYERTGAQVTWLAEPVALLLSPGQFEDFVVPCLRRFFKTVNNMTALHVCGETTYLTEKLVAAGVQALSLDSKVDFSYIMEIVPEDVVLFGNIDPVMMLKAEPARIRREVEGLLKKMQNRPNFVLSTGCLLPPDTPPANIEAFMSAARAFPRRSLNEMQNMKKINSALLKGDEDKVAELINECLGNGCQADDLLNGGLVAGMELAGLKYQYQEMFIPELLMTSRAMYRGLAELKPHLVKEKRKSRGKIVIGTVLHDLHDIGKNLVAIMLEGAGYEVINLGADIAPERFVEAVEEHKPDILALSALTTTTMNSMKWTMQALEKADVRDRVKVIIGGAPVYKEFAMEIGADAYGSDAPEAVKIVAALLAGEERQ